MPDPMDDIRRTFRNAAAPTPDKAFKNKAIEKAMAAFDEKHHKRAKGIAWWRRLMGAVRNCFTPNDGVFMKRSYMVAGGLCAATLVVALLNSSMLTNPFRHSEIVTPPLTVPVDALTVPRPNNAPIIEENEKKDLAAPKEQDARDRTVVTGNIVAQQAKVAAAPPAISESKVMRRFEMQPAGAAGAMADASVIMPAPFEPYAPPYYHDEGRDKFEHVNDNPVKITKEEPVSTFSIDVDTASYASMRAALNTNTLPQKDAVRIEEMINYFPYDYTPPKDKAEPFASHISVMPTPWNKDTKLVHIGIKGYELAQAHKPHANLVFLVDTSGSMNAPNKLPLLKNSLKLLLNSLQPEDTVAIVTYAGSAGTALEPTKVADKAKILSAIENFNAGGSTAGAEGIRQAYALAEQNFDKDGVNRVILATDGDFNVGITDPNELKSFIERKRDTGIFLSVLGFGQGNYNDALMQTLAQNGNGNAAYIDSLSEARKVLVEEASSTLFPIAKDVKIQVEFNPATVAEYRLIGYETRMLKREDFNNDKIDAGEIGAGHTVTAMYEITPVDSAAKRVDPLRYGEAHSVAEAPVGSDEYGFLKIRYKLPKQNKSNLINAALSKKLEVAKIREASKDAQFAAAVAAFGQILRGEGTTQDFSYDDVIALAQSAKGDDTFGHRAEFISLVRLAKSVAVPPPAEPVPQQ